MVAVTAGELSPLVTGVIYCSVIDACQQVSALGLAREWTAALTQRCEEQPDLVIFTSKCLVHRAEFTQLNGAWRNAIEEAQRVSERFSQRSTNGAAAADFYQEGEAHRLQDEFKAAEQAYRGASQWGWLSTYSKLLIYADRIPTCFGRWLMVN